MTNCEICNQELVHGEFEEKLGICVNCIMIESRTDSYKSFFTVVGLILGGFFFTWSLLITIFAIGSVYVSNGGYIYFVIPPLTVCLLIAPGLIYLIFHKSN
jgi:hypothetical protein